MRGLSMFVAVFLILFAFTLISVRADSGKWAGVDETVVERFAGKAGRPAKEPFINWGQGDLPLFIFLIAGATGGFAAGYYFRVLFHEKGREGEPKNDV